MSVKIALFNETLFCFIKAIIETQFDRAHEQRVMQVITMNAEPRPHVVVAVFLATFLPVLLTKQSIIICKRPCSPE